jgi:uncharacterized protein
MKNINNKNKLIAILKKENTPNWVIDHSIAVFKKARDISKNFDVDLDLIETGALLHDIGRSKTNDITHGVIGAKIAKNYGFSDKVLKIIERHIGAGISKEEAIEMGLPPKDYTPQTLEEKIVSYSDNLFNGSDEVDINYTIQKWKKRIKNPEKPIEKLKKLHEELNLNKK